MQARHSNRVLCLLCASSPLMALLSKLAAFYNPISLQ